MLTGENPTLYECADAIEERADTDTECWNGHFAYNLFDTGIHCLCCTADDALSVVDQGSEYMTYKIGSL